MLETIEKTTDKSWIETSLYYNTNLVQKKFKLPSARTFFLYELFLLSFYFLQDKRFRQITKILLNLIRQVKSNKEEAPRFLIDALIELGATFIKIGQFLSTRGDLLPAEYIEALSCLQDSLPPMPFSKIKPLVETELRKPIENIFKSFEETPVAQASIGQVHKATLFSGQEVVVKIQRPDLSSLFYQDLSILRCLATFFERHTKVGKGREWIQIIDEIGKTLFEEIDFVQEGKNANKFRKNLKYEEKIYIPKVFWQYTTRKLITVEFVPGIKITEVETLKENNFDPKELAFVLVNAYFKQVFEDGFYHADPHPGNIVVRGDGAIVFYDFGMVGRINEALRTELAGVLTSVISNDTDTLLRSLKKLELIKEDADLRPIKKIIEEAVYKYYDGTKLSSLDLNGLEEDLKKVFKEKPMRLPSKFTYTLRATGVLEGVCRTLDPDFSLINTAKPYIQNWIKDEMSKSTWTYLKTIFPNQSKLLDKVKVYVDVIKELPKYASTLENKEDEKIFEQSKVENQELVTKNKSLQDKIAEKTTKLQYAYMVVFLLFCVCIGNFLVESNNTFANTFGFILLVISLIGSLGVIGWFWAKFGKEPTRLQW